jgi:hypothetical protein
VIGVAGIAIVACSSESGGDDDAGAAADDASVPTAVSSTSPPPTSAAPTTSTTTSSTTSTPTTVAPTVPPGLPIDRSDQPLAVRDCFTTAAGTVTLIDCQELHHGQVFAIDVPLAGVVLEEPSPDAWSGAASTECAAAFSEFTGGAVESSAFSIVPVLTSLGAPPVVACAVVSLDGAQWAGTAEQIVGAYEGIEVGECFNFPTQDSDAEEVGCDQPHEAEMFLLEAPIGIEAPLATYPTEDEWNAIAARLCDPAFVTYTGQPVGTNDVVYTYVYPLQSSWLIPAQRTMSCAAVNFDGTMLTAPVAP